MQQKESTRQPGRQGKGSRKDTSKPSPSRKPTDSQQSGPGRTAQPGSNAQRDERTRAASRDQDQVETPRVAQTGEELGEGNRTAARRYSEGVKKTIENQDIEALAIEAEEALQGEEGEELRAAEQKGKQGGTRGTHGN
jgi:hypothetical protein